MFLRVVQKWQGQNKQTNLKFLLLYILYTSFFIWLIVLSNIYFNNHLNEHIGTWQVVLVNGFFIKFERAVGIHSDKNNSCWSLRPFNIISILHGPLKYVKPSQK